MIYRVRKIIIEIHKRSVWQVLGVYLAISWGVLNAIDFLTGFAGLPEWTPTFALALLLLGLPVVTATAFIQSGIPGWTADPHEEIHPDDVVGRTPDQVLVVPEAHPLYGSRLFTWKNAIVGGLGGVVLLVGSVVAYLSMWTLGIGPVGSLVAQGVLDVRDPVILAEFENRTDDAALGAAVTEAFQVDLAESQVVTLVDNRLVADALARMGRNPSETVTAALAREVAIREGIKAVVEGEISKVGTGYLLAARIVMPDGGSAIAQFRESATDDAGLLAAIDRLSERVREKAGESLRSIRESEPLDQVTTESLDALKRYAAGVDAAEAGDLTRSLDLLEEAVEIDPTFAMAWRKLSTQLSNDDLDPAREVEALTKMYQNRDRLTERERDLADARYHTGVTLDQDAAMASYRKVLDDYPNDRTALNNLAIAYMDRGELDEAERLLTRAVGGSGSSRFAYLNLSQVKLERGDGEAALVVLDELESAYPEGQDVVITRARILWGMGDAPAAEAAIQEGSERLGDRVRPERIERLLGSIEHSRGRLSEAGEHFGEARRAAERDGHPNQIFPVGASVARARMTASGGDIDAALAPVERLFVIDGAPAPPTSRPYRAIWTLVARSLGDPVRAERWWAPSMEAVPEAGRTSRSENDAARLHDALLALADGRPNEAMETLDAIAGSDPCAHCYLRERAAAQQALGRTEEAAASLQGWLDHRDWDDVEEVAISGLDLLPRLAALYEELDRPSEAAASWLRYANQLNDADTPLRARAERARRRAAELTSGTGTPEG
jgi:eukaryotic-like serine/threonine-protein kinase